MLHEGQLDLLVAVGRVLLGGGDESRGAVVVDLAVTEELGEGDGVGDAVDAADDDGEVLVLVEVGVARGPLDAGRDVLKVDRNEAGKVVVALMVVRAGDDRGGAGDDLGGGVQATNFKDWRATILKEGKGKELKRCQEIKFAIFDDDIKPVSDLALARP